MGEYGTVWGNIGPYEPFFPDCNIYIEKACENYVIT